ncbi:MAG: hypothetical protein QF664_05055 [Dehalococcoidia bacterium]|jgi:hypothetical protein|nr:hypothetical protein [Dehalococcoidia bacterium]
MTRLLSALVALALPLLAACGGGTLESAAVSATTPPEAVQASAGQASVTSSGEPAATQ